MDPWIHRIAASERYSDSLISIKNDWTTGDLTDALVWLDAIAEASESDEGEGAGA